MRRCDLALLREPNQSRAPAGRGPAPRPASPERRGLVPWETPECSVPGFPPTLRRRGHGWTQGERVPVIGRSSRGVACNVRVARGRRRAEDRPRLVPAGGPSLAHRRSGADPGLVVVSSSRPPPRRSSADPTREAVGQTVSHFWRIGCRCARPRGHNHRHLTTGKESSRSQKSVLAWFVPRTDLREPGRGFILHNGGRRTTHGSPVSSVTHSWRQPAAFPRMRPRRQSTEQRRERP